MTPSLSPPISPLSIILPITIPLVLDSFGMVLLDMGSVGLADHNSLLIGAILADDLLFLFVQSMVKEKGYRSLYYR